MSKENAKEVEISSAFWPLQSTQPHTSAGLFIDPYTVAYACFEHLYSHTGVSVSREGEFAVVVQPLKNIDVEWRYCYFLISANHLMVWLAIYNLIFHISIFKACLRTLIGDWQLTVIFSFRGSQYGVTACFKITSSLKVLSSKFRRSAKLYRKIHQLLRSGLILH